MGGGGGRKVVTGVFEEENDRLTEQGSRKYGRQHNNSDVL